jgi:hypothetical protein
MGHLPHPGCPQAMVTASRLQLHHKGAAHARVGSLLLQQPQSRLLVAKRVPRRCRPALTASARMQPSALL